MSTTTVDQVITAHRQEEGGGFIVRRPLPTAGADHFDQSHAIQGLSREADVSGTPAQGHQLVVHERTSGVVRVSGPADGDGAEILLLGGCPIDEPIARYGPFVMNTREEIVQAVEDFNAGRLGSIPAEGSGVRRT